MENKTLLEQELNDFEHSEQPQQDGPVECLGKTFTNDQERREYYLAILAEKLKDPEFRKIEGFPIGEDEDILNLSDPPYYTACPNPFIEDFIAFYGRPYNPSEYYKREPYAADVSEGKNDPIYNAHSYHTKVPYKAIMPYIEHFTSEGDIVFDGFCGTGMTGVAAQMLGRRVLLCDLSPVATFLAKNFVTTKPIEQYAVEAKEIKKQVVNNVEPLYRTEKGYRDFTIYSAIVECPNCFIQFSQWEAVYHEDTRTISDSFECTNCHNIIKSKNAIHVKSDVFDPLLNSVVKTKKRTQSFSKLRKNSGFIEVSLGEDGNSYNEYADEIKNFNIPIIEVPDMYESHFKRNLEKEGITYFHHFYTPRNLIACCRLLEICKTKDDLFKFAFLNTSWHASIMRRYNAAGGHRPKTNTLYVPALSSEGRISKIYNKKVDDILRMIQAKNGCSIKPFISTSSATKLTFFKNQSVDYIFIDPPFGSNIMYSDLNWVWETWLKVYTSTKEEAIENHIQKKSLSDYRKLIDSCFKEFYRILKKGRWMTVIFSNTNAIVWNNIRSSISNAGFIIANISSLDKKQRSITSYTSSTAVKQDLIISAYKPNDGFEERFVNESDEEGVWDFIRTHLGYLPVVKKEGTELIKVPERDPRILFDMVVAYFLRNDRDVPLSSKEFQQGLLERFAERDEMIFLLEQVAEYDKARTSSSKLRQLTIFVDDEASSIEWLRQLLNDKPQTYQDILPKFMHELSGWKKGEMQLELIDLLEQNFLKFNCQEQVPPQIHSYLSTNFKDMRSLAKDDLVLISKAKDRWYVPNPEREEDLQKLRERSLLKHFGEYKNHKGKKIKLVRLEALRAGFKKAWQDRHYETIIQVAEMIPEALLLEDEKLFNWYSMAQTRHSDSGLF